MDKFKDTPSAEFQTAQEAIDWIVGRMEKLGMKPGLQRMQMLMEKLGHPERRLKFIHVAGTNGKGSTCAYLNLLFCRLADMTWVHSLLLI